MAEAKGRRGSGGAARRPAATAAGGPGRLEHLLEEIRAGRPRPVYLCFGEDFLAEQAAQALVAALVPEADRGTNVERVSGDALDPGGLLASLRTPPLFGGRKAVAVFGAGFLASRESAGELLQAARQAWEEGDEDRGARLFLRGLAAAEVDPEDFARADWPDRLLGEPEKLLPKLPAEILQWIPAARSHCLERGLAIPRVSDVGDLLEAELAAGWPQGNVLILVAPAVDQRRRIFKALEAAGGVLAFPLERRREGEVPRDVLRRELQARAAAAGKRVAPDAEEAILGRAGGSLRGFAHELEKLFTYVGGAPAVTAEDVEAAFGDRAEPYLFDLTNALAERDAGRALRVLRALVGQGAEPLYLISVLAGEVRRLIQARELLDGPLREAWRPDLGYGAFQARVWEPARTAAPAGADPAFFALHPFRAYQVLRGASRFIMEDLVRALERLAEADLELKSSGLPPAQLLEVALLDLCRPPDAGAAT